MEFRVQFLNVSWFCKEGRTPIYHSLLNAIYSKPVLMIEDDV